jgi:hypothetical protein
LSNHKSLFFQEDAQNVTISKLTPINENHTEHKPVLEVVCPGRPQQSAPVAHSPFLIGRSGNTSNDLELEGEHVLRRCAAIVAAMVVTA